MSSTQWQAKFSVSISTFFWATAISDRGNIADNPRIIDETLITPGVDYARWRRRYSQFKPFQLTTTEDATSDGDNCDLVSNYEASIGLFGTLTVTYRTTTRTWKNVKVIDVMTKDFSGPFFGFGASSGSVCGTMGIWQLQLTQVST